MRSVSPIIVSKGTLKRRTDGVNLLNSDVSNGISLNPNDYPSIKVAKLGDGSNDNVSDSENLLGLKNDKLVDVGDDNSPLTEENLILHDRLQKVNSNGLNSNLFDPYINENNPNGSNPAQSKFSPKKLKIDEVDRSK